MANLTIERLYELMADIFMLDDFKFSRAMGANEVPNWDSLNHSILIMEISAEVGVHIAADEAAKQASIGDLYKFICSRVDVAKQEK